MPCAESLPTAAARDPRRGGRSPSSWSPRIPARSPISSPRPGTCPSWARRGDGAKLVGCRRGPDCGHVRHRSRARRLDGRKDERPERRDPSASGDLRRAAPRRALAGCGAGRRRLVLGARQLRPGAVELALRPLVARRRDRPQRGAARSRRGDRARSAPSRDDALPHARRVRGPRRVRPARADPHREAAPPRCRPGASSPTS